MSNPNLNDINFDENQSSTLKEYLILFSANIKPVTAILITSLIISILYAISAPNIFRTSTALKITKPGGSILQSPLMPEISDYGNDLSLIHISEPTRPY